MVKKTCLLAFAFVLAVCLSSCGSTRYNNHGFGKKKYRYGSCRACDASSYEAVVADKS